MSLSGVEEQLTTRALRKLLNLYTVPLEGPHFRFSPVMALSTFGVDASGHYPKFIVGSGLGCRVVEVEAARGVRGFLGAAHE